MDHYKAILKYNDKVSLAIDTYIKDRFGFHIKEFSTSEYIKTNTKKGLLLHDKLDKITPYIDSKNVHKNWKDSKFITTEGLGHSMHQEHINDQIIDFLNN